MENIIKTYMKKYNNHHMNETNVLLWCLLIKKGVLTFDELNEILTFDNEKLINKGIYEKAGLY